MMSSAGELRVDQRELLGAAVLEPRGVLDASSYGELRTFLIKAAIDEPRAVIVDLVGLAVANRASLLLFPSVYQEIAQWPGVPLLLVVEEDRQGELLGAGRMSRFVPVYPSVAAAATAVGDEPLRRIARRRLPNSLSAAGLARAFVAETCLQWGLAAQRGVATMIVNELVENTLVHTYSAPSLRLEMRRALLTVAVYDDDPARPEIRADGRRHGLIVVADLARAWGSMPTTSGGKVVWATLRL